MIGVLSFKTQRVKYSAFSLKAGTSQKCQTLTCRWSLLLMCEEILVETATELTSRKPAEWFMNTAYYFAISYPTWQVLWNVSVLFPVKLNPCVGHRAVQGVQAYLFTLKKKKKSNEAESPQQHLDCMGSLLDDGWPSKASGCENNTTERQSHSSAQCWVWMYIMIPVDWGR